MQIRLASLARNFRDRMHDPADSRPRCFPSLQCVPTAHSKGPLLGAVALVDASASRRFRRRPDQVPWYGRSGRADSPCSGSHIRLEIIALVSPDRYLSQRYNVGHGSDFESLSSLTPVRSSPFHPWKSPHRIRSALPQGVPHTESATIMCSLMYLLSVRQTISGLTTSFHVHLCRTRSTRTQQCTLTLHVCVRSVAVLSALVRQGSQVFGLPSFVIVRRSLLATWTTPTLSVRCLMTWSSGLPTVRRPDVWESVSRGRFLRSPMPRRLTVLRSTPMSWSALSTSCMVSPRCGRSEHERYL